MIEFNQNERPCKLGLCSCDVRKELGEGVAKRSNAEDKSNKGKNGFNFCRFYACG